MTTGRCDEDDVDDLIKQVVVATTLEKNQQASFLPTPPRSASVVTPGDFVDPMDRYLAERLAKLRSTPASVSAASTAPSAAKYSIPSTLITIKEDEGDEDDQADDILRQVLDEIDLETKSAGSKPGMPST